MKTSGCLLLLVMLSSAGCLELPPIGEPLPPSAEIVWRSPAAPRTYTNRTLRLEVEVAGAADAVEFYRDEVLLVRRTVPPFVHDWVTGGESEGEHILSVRVFRGEVSLLGESRQVVVDRTSPSITARFPVDVPRLPPNTLPSVTFSEAMAPIAAGAVRFESARGNVAANVALATDGRTATLAPAQPFLRDVNLFVRFDDAARPTDLAGNPIADASDWRFRIDSWLQLGTDLSALPGATHASIPSLVIDGFGSPVVAFLEHDGTAIRLFAFRWNDGWQRLGERVSDAPGDSVSRPRLFRGPQDDVLLMWSERQTSPDGYYSQLQSAAYRWGGGGWYKLQPLPALIGAGTRYCEPVAAPGKVLAFCANRHLLEGSYGSIERFESSYGVWTGGKVVHGTYPSAETPGPTSVVRRDQERHLVGYSAMDRTVPARPRGVAHVADGNLASIGPALTSSSEGSAEWVSVAAGPDGTPYAAWILDPGDATRVEVARFDGAQWVRFADGLQSGLVQAAWTSLALDSEGRLVLAFTAVEDGERFVFVRRWTGDRWEPVGGRLRAHPGLAAPAGYAVAWSQMVIDPDDRVVLAWQEGDSNGVRNIEVFRSND